MEITRSNDTSVALLPTSKISSAVSTLSAVPNNPNDTAAACCEDGKPAVNYFDAAACGIKPYNKSLAMALTLNCAIGTGCVGLPYAFSEAGLVLTSFLLIFGSITSILSMNYIIEALSRAEGLLSQSSDLKMSYRKFDYAMLGSVLISNVWGRELVLVVMGIYCSGALWSYASVFSSSMASIFYMFVYSTTCDVYSSGLIADGCQMAYLGAMGLFALVVLTLVLKDMQDQATLQRLLTLYRVVALSLMLITLIVKIAAEPSAMARRMAAIGTSNWSKFPKGFGPSMLALTCHFNMPEVLQPLVKKSDAQFVALVSLVLSSVFYLALGLLGAVAFDDVNPLITLNFADFSMCGASGFGTCLPSASTFRVTMGLIVRLLLLLFPVVNVASAYPLVGISLGDNMLSSLPLPWITRMGSRQRAKQFCRLVAAGCPLILATLFKKLDLILTLGGLVGFTVTLTLPCMFQVQSIRKCVSTFATSATDFTVPWVSAERTAIALGVLSIAITISAFSTLAVTGV